MRKLFGSALFSLFVGLGSFAGAQQWADLEITFVFDGDIPKMKPIDMAKDPACSFQMMEESLVVNPNNKGIQNVGLWVDAKKSKLGPKEIHPDLQAVPKENLLLDNKQCVFIPHALFARAGQTIEVKNSDSTGHNANFNFLNNMPVNFVVPSGASMNTVLAPGVEEPAPIPVQCNVHPWMEAKLMVLDHPYGGFSDANGMLKILKLPAGKKLTFRIYHENSNKSIEELDVDGKKQEWKKGYTEMDLKAGDNKMKIKISSSRFKAK